MGYVILVIGLWEARTGRLTSLDAEHGPEGTTASSVSCHTHYT